MSFDRPITAAFVLLATSYDASTHVLHLFPTIMLMLANWLFIREA